MKKLLLTLLLAVVSSSAMAEWVKLDENAKLTIYFDRATVRKSDDMSYFWLLFDYKNDQQDIPNETFRSMKYKLEIDCTGERTRSLYTSHIAGNMGFGDVVAVINEPAKWIPIVPDSLSMTLWRGSCGKAE